MEDRLTSSTARRPGAASAALAAISVITAAWWALALWPAGDFPPAWLASTRAVCFGVRGSGPPDFGGWLFLIGEPAGLLVMLTVIGGGALRAELAFVRQWLDRHPMMRVAGMAAAAVAIVAALQAAVRPTAGIASPLPTGNAQPVDLPAPPTTLVDQHGASVVLADVREPSIVTVAFAHCDVICPTTVRHITSARVAAGHPEMPLYIVTVDPWRDTIERLPTIARSWALSPTDHVLSGDTTVVARTLDLLAVGRQRDEKTGDVAHAIVVLLLDGRGRVSQRFDGDARGLAAALTAQR